MRNWNKAINILNIINIFVILIVGFYSYLTIFDKKLEILGYLYITTSIFNIIIGIINFIKKQKTEGSIQILIGILVFINTYFANPYNIFYKYYIIKILIILLILILTIINIIKKNEKENIKYTQTVIFTIYGIIEILLVLTMLIVAEINIKNFEKNIPKIEKSKNTTAIMLNSGIISLKNDKNKEINRLINHNNYYINPNILPLNINGNEKKIGYINSNKKIIIINSEGEELFELYCLGEEGDRVVGNFWLNYICLKFPSLR